jgi:DNA-binding PadR family transcriptional regulator
MGAVSGLGPGPSERVTWADDGRAGWSHGYDLCRALSLRAGTVYPILIRLAERGQVETSWETGPPRGRPPRHLYRLTTAGAELARAVAAPARRSRARPGARRNPLSVPG